MRSEACFSLRVRVWVSVWECKREKKHEVCGLCYQSCRSWGPVLGPVKDRQSSFLLFFPFCSQPGRMVPRRGCQWRGLSCRWMEQSSSSIVSASTVAVAASVLWLWSSDSGWVSAVLFASLPLPCTRSLSLSASYSLTHLLFSLCYSALPFPTSSSLSHYPFIIHCISIMLISYFISPCPFFFLLSRAWGKLPPSSSLFPLTPLPLAALERQLETSSAHTGLRSSHKRCSPDQRGRETSRA